MANLVNSVSFYNQFHKKTSRSSKIINKNNFVYQYIIESLDRILSGKNESILDFGCGSGTIDFYLASIGYRVMGYDLSTKAINECLKQNEILRQANKPIFTSKLADLKNKKFDVVICTEVVEHVKNDREVVSQLFHALNKGGKLLISVPSKNAPLYKMGLLKKFDESVGHLRRYTKESICEVLLNSGFKIVYINKTESIIRNILFTTKLGVFIKLLRFGTGKILNGIDQSLVNLIGESDIIIIAQKP